MGVTRYQSKDESYVVKHKRHFRRTLFYKLSGLIISLVLFVVLFVLSTASNDIVKTIYYGETFTRDYDVKLLPNDKYGAVTLESKDNTDYVSSIIDKINTKFNYTLNATDKVKMKYKYNATATLYIMNYDNGNLLQELSDKLDSKEEDSNEQFYSVNKEYSIDYQRYANEVSSYKSTFHIPVKAKLVVTFGVSVNALEDNFTNKLNKNVVQQITIPIGEATTTISLDTPNKNIDDQLIDVVDFRVTNVFLFILCVLFFISAIYFLILVVIKIYRLSTKDIYNNTLNKILKNYDKVIVSGRITINEDNYDNIIYPETFEEMVDASVNEQSPILYYEVIPNEKSFFIIVKDNTLYKYRLSRSVLEGERK